MPTSVNRSALAQQVRRSYVEGLLGGLPALMQTVAQGASTMLTQVAVPALAARRRDLLPEVQRAQFDWLRGLTATLHGALATGEVPVTRSGELVLTTGRAALSLVDDDTIEHEILSARLALSMTDQAGAEFADLGARITDLEGRVELSSNDVLRLEVLARLVTAAWRGAGLSVESWRLMQPVLHDALAQLAQDNCHEANRYLVQRHVLPQINLRPHIRRSPESAPRAFAPTGDAASPPSLTGSGRPVRADWGPRAGPSSRPSPEDEQSEVNQETRLMTRLGGLDHGTSHAEAVLGRLNRLVGRQLPEFADTSTHPPSASPQLSHAIAEAQQGIARRLSPAFGSHTVTSPVSTPLLIEELNQRRQALKQAATTPVERASIEIVALLFQSILTEERIPPSVRVWFARLQMPVLRVAVSEPDFFATLDHPARRLIDRMGACVMGFDATSRVIGALLEKEIKRVVQVVEAYPDTGRRVFQTVLLEFETFLEHYFKNQNEASRNGVSLAQQVEQRETLAIQYTIELRKMLNEMPVQEGVREFLFQVWADVLAMAAIKAGNPGEATKRLKRAAADLIWSASAKVSREERADVIRRLPPLLKTLRDGMDHSGVSAAKQDEHIRQLNNSLAAAFTAKAAAIPHERLEELTARLDRLEELLPEAADLEIDESMVHDLSGHESSQLEVVSEGGSMPTAAMLAWARELQVGSWYMLDYRRRNETMQLAWQGMRRQLTLFVSPHGRGVLFQQNRLAAFLQAGLLVPAQDESLTVRATRNAMAKLDHDPGRLLN